MKTDKVLWYAIIGGLFLLPFIPFVVTNSMFFPFITGKSFAFRIITEIIFGLWIILAFKNTIYRPSFSWILVALASFVGIMAIADIFGENPFKSFWSNFERMEGLVALIHYLMLFVVMGTVLNTKKIWGWLAATSIGASVIMAVYGFVQISGKLVINQGGVRVDGTFGNASYLAIYMLFHIFIALLFIIKWRGHISIPYILGGVILLQTIILYYTATRGAILGLLGALLLIALLSAFFGKEYPRVRKGSIFFLIISIISISSFFVGRNTDFVQNNLTLSRFANISLSEDNPRLTIWGMAYKGFKEKPLLGWGQDNFNLVFNKYYEPSLYNDEPWFDRSHNILVDWLIYGGILGLLAYLSIFLASLYCVWCRQSKVHFSMLEKNILTGLFAGYFFNNLFIFDNVMSSILLMATLAYIYSATRGAVEENSFFAQDVKKATINRFVIPVSVLFIVGSIYFLNVPGILTSKNIIYALTARESLSERTAFLEKAASYKSLGSQEVAEQTVQAAFLSIQSNASNEERVALFDLAEKVMSEEIDRAPDDARLHVFLGSLYDQFGKLDKARREFSRAIELSPKKQRIHFQLAFNYLNLKEYDRAFEIFKKVHEFAPELDEPRIYYAVAALYNGQSELAEELLEDVRRNLNERGVPVIGNDTLLRAYAETGRFDEVLEIWRYRVEQNPNDVDTRLSLAATLIQLNRNTEAIEEVKKAININPNLKTQGEFFIQEIRAGRGKALIQGR